MRSVLTTHGACHFVSNLVTHPVDESMKYLLPLFVSCCNLIAKLCLNRFCVPSA